MPAAESDLDRWNAAKYAVKGTEELPRRFDIGDYLRVVARADPARLRRVPSSAITEEGDDEAFVACPCGSHPVVGPGLEKCASCERYYVLVAAGSVYVVYGEMESPPIRAGL